MSEFEVLYEPLFCWFNEVNLLYQIIRMFAA
jgi:hypothetical protein